MSGQSGLSWNVVAGRHRGNRGVSRGGRGGNYGARAKQVVKPAAKRPRVSDDSAGTVPGMPPPLPAMSLPEFKQLSMDEKMERMYICLQGIMVTTERLLKGERVVNELRNTSHVNRDRINMLAYKSIDSEARQRRNNLLFWGVPETLGEDCIALVKDFLSDKLHLDHDKIFIQRAHRLGKLKQRSHRGGQPKHRPIIAAFRDYPDVELILSNADKLGGTSCGINRDYPQEIVNARKPLFREKKALKLKHPTASISVQFPAKLVKDGRVIRDMFPEWHTVLKRDRLDQQRYNMDSQADYGDGVFESSDTGRANNSDNDFDSYDRMDENDNAQFSIAEPTGSGTTVGALRGLQSPRPPDRFQNGNESDHSGVSDTAGATQSTNEDA